MDLAPPRSDRAADSVLDVALLGGQYAPEIAVHQYDATKGDFTALDQPMELARKVVEPKARPHRLNVIARAKLRQLGYMEV